MSSRRCLWLLILLVLVPANMLCAYFPLPIGNVGCDLPVHACPAGKMGSQVGEELHVYCCAVWYVGLVLVGMLFCVHVLTMWSLDSRSLPVPTEYT